MAILWINDINANTRIKMNKFKINNRRYTGSKYKLLPWICEKISLETKDIESFFDIFAGTGCVAERFADKKKLIINDFLYSNNVIYNAFFNSKKFNEKKLIKLSKIYSEIIPTRINDNYFNLNFGNKFFSQNDAKIIGYIRENIQNEDLTNIEKNILLSSLIYSADKSANTVGHYDAFRKKIKLVDKFTFKLIEPLTISAEVKIYREDANILAKKILADVCYIDPPYNSRQYSRFYHLLENLVKWEKPKLFGEALKPEPENISDYCKTKAPEKFKDLIENLKCKYIVVSYNNTYKSNSSSSKNKITLDFIKKTLENNGKTKIFKKNHPHFNAGKTNFNNHQEYLFITKK